MAACPDEATLLALVEGKLARVVARPVQRHIDACRSCQLASAEAARTATVPGVGNQAPLPARAPGAGTIIAGRYALDRMIGRGGIGAVWSGQRLRDREWVAIKFLHDVQPDWTRRLEREARLGQQVAHPALVQVHELIPAEADGPALVMELLHGQDLSAYVEHHAPLSAQETAAILAPAAEAIASLHAHQIAHRDLKPANLFLEHGEAGQRRTRVLDLGMARSLDLERATYNASRLTSAGMVLGTPRYMAPEQFEGAREVDTRADIWALGAIAYRMLSGRSHVAGFRYAEVLRAIHTEPISALSSLVAEVPPALASIIQRSLSIAPEQRPTVDAWLTVLCDVIDRDCERARGGDR